MPAFLIAALRYWKLAVLGALCVALAVQSVRLGHRTNQLEKERINSNELRAELKAISDAKNRQGETTKGNIDKAKKSEREAVPIVKIIREAPIPPNCATPGLDVLRNEI